MIQFNCLIHKETGTVIKYEDWIKGLETERTFVLTNSEKMHILKAGEKSFYAYPPKEMLFNDDFEIIYDSDFTLEELRIIFRGNQKYNSELMKKINSKIKKYGIEV